MYQKIISLLFILALSLSILISCGGDPGTNIKSGKVLTGYYTSDNAYYPMEYKRSDIVATNDNYTISFRLPESEPFHHYYEVPDKYLGKIYLKNGAVPYNKIDYSDRLFDLINYGFKKLPKKYKNKVRNIGDEPYVMFIERTDIKTEKLNNPKYYLAITINGVEEYIIEELDIYEVYQNENGLYRDRTTGDTCPIYGENINIVFTTMMRDGPKDELKPIHVENYWFYENYARQNWDGMSEIGRQQIAKFIDEIDFGYRGKLPPKPIDEDDEY